MIIQSVAVQFLVVSRLIALSCVYAYIHIFTALDWERKAINIFKYGFIPHFQACDIYIQNILPGSFCCS
jgi:hypothetical protein